MATKQEIVQALIKYDTTGKIVFQATKYLHYLPIHVACGYRKELCKDVIRCLLHVDEQRRTLCLKTKQTGRFALHVAVENKVPTEVIQMLLEEDFTQKCE